MSYIQITTPLVLHADPVLPGHAATKRYVDNKKNNLNAASFTTGTISVARIPNLTGDIISLSGSGDLSLQDSGVTPGIYTKLTIDAKGRVVSGSTLSSSDIVSFDWNKITSGKPNTPAGYGITNLIALSGGTSADNISSSSTPSSALHAVTKSYVDNAITGVVAASLNTGDIIRKSVGVSPPGFLRCNGGEVNKTLYASLYTIIGEKYSYRLTPGTTPGAGKPWSAQYDFNENNQTTMQNWGFSDLFANFETKEEGTKSFITKNNLYILGGRVPPLSSSSNKVYRASIYPDGTVSALISYNLLPSILADFETIIIKDKVHLLGGVANGIYKGVYTATIDADGFIGEWSYINNRLYRESIRGHAVVTSSRVYMIGGDNGTGPSSVIQSAAVNLDGTLNTWSSSGSFPTTLERGTAVVIKNKVYVIGGHDGTFPSSKVYMASINSSGIIGAWSQVISLPYTLYEQKSVVTKNRIYMFGGVCPSNVFKILTAAINSDGTLGTWSEIDSPLPGAFALSDAFLTKNYLNLVGSENGFLYYKSFQGGFNDYTNIYNDTPGVTKVDNFNLPDFSTLEKDGVNYYIKS